MKIFILLFTYCLLQSVYGISFLDLGAGEWDLFKIQYNKVYNNTIEESYRMKIFIENKLKIVSHNKLYELGLETYKLQMNEFGDLLHHEFMGQMNGYNQNLLLLRGDNGDEAVTFIPPFNVTAPDVVDWRTEGAVTPIKNQGKCGSCWAFSATGALEGQNYRKTGELVSLSEQNLIDCSRKYGNHGCEGGLMDQAFTYIKENNGIDTEVAYPYEAEDDKCRYNPKKKAADDKGFVDIPEGDEDQLKIAVATVGPISVAIDAGHASFQFYNHGVYYRKGCSSTKLDHGVLVVGYGTTQDDIDYWLVKNSWGKEWGLSGYIKMARNRKNNCGIASSASYPLV